MVRLFNVYYPTRVLILLAGEALIVCSSFILAAYVRFGRDAVLFLNFEGGYGQIALAAGVCLICLYYFDLYDSLIISNPREVLTRLIQVLGATCLIMAPVSYVLPTARLEIGVFLIGIVVAGIFLGLWRKLFLMVNASPSLARRALILGTGPQLTSLSREIEKRPEWGVRLTGYVGEPPNSPAALNGLSRLGAVEELVPLVERERVSQVIVAMGERRGRLPVEDLLKLKTRGVLIQDGSDVYETLTGKVPLDSLRLSWLIFSSRGFPVSQVVLLYKRLMSILLSAVGLILVTPLMAIIAVALRLDSKGPVIFRQKRVGQDGKLFDLFKFRTMRHSADPADQSRPAQENDDRITRVGRWLRRTRLDELPQLYNILRGDMYFIGPRPFVPNQEQEMAEKIPFYSQRWAVRPGATGWAQINHGYCATVEDNAEKLAYDLFYIKNMSIGLDLLIAFRTVKVLLLGRGSR
ncbi:MAG: TIGR03013 family PEP-CTERM/XrtA system glycosyltransferase [Acidobacteriia bacterium]|nr:TIGR03013 family PEP-CTERM/XrtA system glycosyltransferase [Terriglobia bacterium]